MPANPITALTDRRVLKRIVDERIRPYTALTNLLFPPSARENLFEEFAQVDVRKGTYGMAPFVKVGQKAVLVASLNGTSYTIDTPFINIKRPLQYSTKMAVRLVGGSVFTDMGQTLEYIRQALEADANYMNTLIDDRIEWMASQMLTGEVSYSEEGNDAFKISTGKPAANTITVSAKWDDGSAFPLEDIMDVKKVVAARRGPIPNIGICGSEAGAALRGMLEGNKITAMKTDSGIDTGRANLLSQIQEDGMVFIGRLGDVDFFEYLGTYIADSTGTETALIRAEYVEYFSTSPRAQADRKLMFGMIPDLKAIMDNAHVTDRYFVTKPPEVDQGTYEGIMKSRPLPWFYRPDHLVSQMVVA
jgi:hypothetical protein